VAFAVSVLAILAGCDSAADRLASSSALAPTAPRAITAASTTIDLGSLGGGGTFATAIGKMGYITGASSPSGGGQHAMLWTRTTGMRDLGTLGLGAIGLAVNGKGEVAGVYYPNETAPPRAFFWSEKTGMVDIGVFPGGTTSTAKGINDAGTVVGWSTNGQNALRAFVWTLAGGMKDPGDLGGPGTGATAINNLGVIVGWSDRSGNGGTAATRWVPGRPPQDLGTPGVSSEAVAINDAGLIVGEIDVWVNGVFGRHAMYWRERTGMVDIGTLGGRESGATAVNSVGNIFGYSDVPGGTGWHAFEWSAGTGMNDIFPATGFTWVSGVLDRTVVAYSSTAVRLSN
jgi:probable HAF family extracellular repeat protein